MVLFKWVTISKNSCLLFVVSCIVSTLYVDSYEIEWDNTNNSSGSPPVNDVDIKLILNMFVSTTETAPFSEKEFIRITDAFTLKVDP